MLRLAQASSSEDFTRYGVSPNQRRTGVTKDRPGGNMDGELNVIEFYGGWEYVLRATDPRRAEFLAVFAEHAVANGSHIGYNWGDTSLFDWLKAYGKTDPADITGLVNVDCGTFLGADVYFSGVHIDKLRTLCTWQIEDVLLPTGLFMKLTDKELLQTGKGMKRGDIFVKTGHTATAIDTDGEIVRPRVELSEDGLVFADESGKVTASYPAEPARLLKDNLLRTQSMAENSWYPYSVKGTATYRLKSDKTYLLVFCNRNSTSADCDVVYFIAAHSSHSHLIPIVKSSKTSVAVNGLSLTVTRGCTYGRLALICLS